MTIRAAHYDEAVTRLVHNPIVQQMAAEIAVARLPLDRFFHEEGTPRFDFMLAANATYAERGGDIYYASHIGAVAEALYRILTTIPKGDDA